MALPRVSRRAAISSGIATAAFGIGSGSAVRAQVKKAAASTIRFVPYGNLPSLDPIATPGYAVRNHAFLVFDQLFALDANFMIRPQMAEGVVEENDGKVWRIKLRERLLWHDGERVLARDCVASLKRWFARDPLATEFAPQVEEISAADDRTIVVKASGSMPLLDIIAKPQNYVAFMMPERLAKTDPARPISEAIGSGPFRFQAAEWVPGAKAAYQRFDQYEPRNEPPSFLAGGKVAKIDRVEWLMIPDQNTALSALRTGEIDWLEQLPNDLVAVARRDRNLKVVSSDPYGQVNVLRFNHLHAPFDKVGNRQAILQAILQKDYLNVLSGDPDLVQACESFFPCSPGTVSNGVKAPGYSGDLKVARELLQRGGYAGEKVVVLAPSDNELVKAPSQLTYDVLRKLGMNAELALSDFATMQRRRSSQQPIAEGGWNIAHTFFSSIDFMSPLSSFGVRAPGLKGWAGWADSPRLQELRMNWIRTADSTQRLAITKQMDKVAFEDLPLIPVGQTKQMTAHKANVQNVLYSNVPIFWNVSKG